MWCENVLWHLEINAVIFQKVVILFDLFLIIQIKMFNFISLSMYEIEFLETLTWSYSYSSNDELCSISVWSELDRV